MSAEEGSPSLAEDEPYNDENRDDGDEDDEDEPMSEDEVSEEGRSYCVCKSTDTGRFMIACDQCQDWFHGDCVQVTENRAKNIKKFFCPLCKSVNPALETVYHASVSHKKKVKPKEEIKEEIVNCGQCIGCFRETACVNPQTIQIKVESKPTSTTSTNSKSSHTKKSQQRKAAGRVGTPPQPKVKNVRDPRPKSNRGRPSNASKLAAAALAAVGIPGGAGGGQTKSDMGGSTQLTRKNAHLVGGTRLGAKKYNEFLKEAGLVKDEDSLSGSGLAGGRQCLGPKCINAAKKNSKYCGEECGLALARLRLTRILPARLAEWNARVSAATEREQAELADCHRRQTEASQQLAALSKAVQRVDAWITGRVEITPVQDEQEAMETDQQTDNSATGASGSGSGSGPGEEGHIHCVTCGVEIPSKTAIKHMNKCFRKYEAQASYGSAVRHNNSIFNLFCEAYNKQNKTYCKRLKVICPEHSKEKPPRPTDKSQACGYPLTFIKNLEDVFASDLPGHTAMCRRDRRKCSQHTGWETLARALIDQQRLNIMMQLDELLDESRTIRNAMGTRGGVLALMLHSTATATTTATATNPIPTA